MGDILVTLSFLFPSRRDIENLDIRKVFLLLPLSSRGPLLMRIILSLDFAADIPLSRLKKREESLPPMFLSYSYIYRTESSLFYRLYPVRVFLAIIARKWRRIC
jgi:hypothetical protein